MPIVGVKRDALFEALGRTYSEFGCQGGLVTSLHRQTAAALGAIASQVPHLCVHAPISSSTSQQHSSSRCCRGAGAHSTANGWAWLSWQGTAHPAFPRGLPTRSPACLPAHCTCRVLPAAADEEFDQLCFEYGIELDDVVSACMCCGGGRAWHARRWQLFTRPPRPHHVAGAGSNSGSSGSSSGPGHPSFKSHHTCSSGSSPRANAAVRLPCTWPACLPAPRTRTRTHSHTHTHAPHADL